MSTEFAIDFKETVRAQTDIVALISEYVSLTPKRGGRDHECLCPFHDDHNPSMTVSVERQSYKCWSCGESGDCFSFVMNIEGISFRETLENLARRANLEMPQTFHRLPAAKTNHKASLIEIVSWAEKLFHHELLNSPAAEPARRYLHEERGFTDETIERFRVGYHPGGWDWLIGKAQGKFNQKQLFEARLTRERNGGGGYYDDFRQRVLFPIRNEKGEPVAFGGRILPEFAKEGSPKYLNSPESEIFLKSKILYGFDAAKEAIRKSEVAIVVEGYTDCITLQQFGFPNVVGTLGVALSDDHVKLLKRFAHQKMILVYDGDAAGQKATERSISQFLSHDVELRILILPNGMDPADYLESLGAESLQNALNSAPEALEFKYQVCRERFGDSIHGREQILGEMLDLVRLAPNIAGTLKEDLILNRLAQRLSVNEQVLRDLLIEKRKEHSQQARMQAQRQEARQAHAAAAQPTQSIQPVVQAPVMPENWTSEKLARNPECELLQILCVEPACVLWVSQQLAPTDLENGPMASLLQLCYDLYEQGESPTFERVLAALEDSEYKKFVIQIEELSRNLDIVSKVREEEIEVEGETVSRYLHQAVQVIKGRRQEREALSEIKRGVSQFSETSMKSALDASTIEALQKATAFHRQRANKRTLD